jgi:hypothetical protein
MVDIDMRKLFARVMSILVLVTLSVLSAGAVLTLAGVTRSQDLVFGIIALSSLIGGGFIGGALREQTIQRMEARSRTDRDDREKVADLAQSALGEAAVLRRELKIARQRMENYAEANRMAQELISELAEGRGTGSKGAEAYNGSGERVQ